MAKTQLGAMAKALGQIAAAGQCVVVVLRRRTPLTSTLASGQVTSQRMKMA